MLVDRLTITNAGWNPVVTLRGLVPVPVYDPMQIVPVAEQSEPAKAVQIYLTPAVFTFTLLLTENPSLFKVTMLAVSLAVAERNAVLAAAIELDRQTACPAAVTDFISTLSGWNPSPEIDWLVPLPMK